MPQVYYAESDTEVTTTSTSYVDGASLVFTPDASETYYLVAAWQAAYSVSAIDTKSKLVHGASTYSNPVLSPINATDYFSFGQLAIFTASGSPSAETLKIQYAGSGSGNSAKLKNQRLAAIRKGANDQHVEVTTQATTTSTTFQDGASITWTPTAGDYLILCAADMGYNSGVLPGVRLNIDGATYGSTQLDSQSNGQMFAWAHSLRVTLTAASHTIKLQYRTANSGTTSIQQQRIIAIRLDAYTANYYAEDRASTTTTSSTYVDRTTRTSTPAATSHLVFASTVGSANSQNTHAIKHQLIEGATVKAEMIVRSRQPFNLQTSSFFTFYALTGSGSSTTWKTQYATATSNTIGISDSSIAVIEYGGGGATDHVLAGAASGTSSAAGTLTLEQAIAGAAAGTSSAVGTLALTHALAGAASGASSAAGTLVLTHGLAGAASGTSSAAGTLTLQQALAGAASGTSSAAGTFTPLVTDPPPATDSGGRRVLTVRAIDTARGLTPASPAGSRVLTPESPAGSRVLTVRGTDF